MNEIKNIDSSLENEEINIHSQKQSQIEDEKDKDNIDNFQLSLNNNKPNKRQSQKLENWSSLKDFIKNLNVKKTIISNSNDLVIYTITFNMNGKFPSKEEIKKLLPKKTKNNLEYNLYVIASQETIRTIFRSFFNSEMGEWVNMIQ